PVGYDSAAPVTIAGTGCAMNINGAGWTSVGANVSPTQAIGVRTTSSASQASTVDCTLSVGGVSDIFSVTTEDTTPDAFVFTDVTEAALSTLTTHANITPVGYDSAAPVTIAGTGCAMNINGAGWTSVGANVSPTQAIGVRTTSSASQATTVDCTLSVGGVSDIFSVT
ncbi:MAG: hypothetical protein GY697_22820, partial [Desulfobacterales bacterium]|nr:hypothetical protein [Desulfobacterales bacterium]